MKTCSESGEGEIDSNSQWGKWQNTESVCEARDMPWPFLEYVAYHTAPNIFLNGNVYTSSAEEASHS